MKSAFLFKQLLLLVAGFVTINIAVALASRHSLPRQVIHAIDASSPRTDLFVGNSLVAAGLDVSAYEKAAPESRGLSIGLGSSWPVEHDLLLRRALRTKPQRVFYGFFDTQITDPASDSSSFGDLCGNRALVHFIDRETAIRFLSPDDVFKAWRIRLVSFLPVMVERMAIWAKVEIVRRRLGEIGLAQQATNQFGRAGDFTLLEAGDPHVFARRCADLAKQQTGFNTPVTDMVTQVHGDDAQFVLVEMPMPASHRRRFYSTPEWAAYEDDLEQFAKKCGVGFVNASDWIGDAGFADALHLNAQGANEFSQKLAIRRLGTQL